MKNPKKKAAMMKRARSGVKGLIATWIDPDPMSSGGTEFSEMDVTHRSPVWKLAAADVLRNHGDWIINQAKFLWRVDISVYFEREDGELFSEDRDFEDYVVMDDINDLCFEVIEDALADAGRRDFKHVRFRVECIGLEPKKPLVYSVQECSEEQV